MDATASRSEATYPLKFDVDEFLALSLKLGARKHQDRAELVAVNRSTIDRWQTGEAVPRLDTALHVARTLGVTVEALWKLADVEVAA